MQTEAIKTLVETVLDEMQAIDPVILDVKNLTTVTDYMVICSGRSSRHVKAIASSLVEKAKHAGCQPLGVEGEQTAEWILIDLNDVVVHIMQPEVREFYNIEKLWAFTEPKEKSLS